MLSIVSVHTSSHVQGESTPAVCLRKDELNGDMSQGTMALVYKLPERSVEGKCVAGEYERIVPSKTLGYYILKYQSNDNWDDTYTLIFNMAARERDS